MKFFNESESQTQDLRFKVPPEGLVLMILRPEKLHRPQPILNPRILNPEARKLPRDHRGQRLSILPKLKSSFHELISNPRSSDLSISFLIQIT